MISVLCHSTLTVVGLITMCTYVTSTSPRYHDEERHANSLRGLGWATILSQVPDGERFAPRPATQINSDYEDFLNVGLLASGKLDGRPRSSWSPRPLLTRRLTGVTRMTRPSRCEATLSYMASSCRKMYSEYTQRKSSWSNFRHLEPSVLSLVEFFEFLLVHV